LAADATTAEEIIAGHRQLIDRAHMHGLKAIGATLTPYGGAFYYSEAGEAMRQAVNQWIRTGGAYDAVVDFDAVIRDPANPAKMQQQFNPGDNLHPNDAGYKAMAEALNLTLFQ
jgi:lysophospholipase L1-like esterase